MRKQSWIVTTLTTCAVTTATIARAQPDPSPPAGDGSNAGAARPTAHVSAPSQVYTEPSTTSPTVFAVAPADVLYPSARQGDWTLVENERGYAGWIKTSTLAAPAAAAPAPEAPAVPDVDAKPRPPAKPRPKDPHIDMPEVLTTPTGWLLPAAVLYSRTSLDTGGGVASDSRVGLGDVAEFGVSTTDQIRARTDPNALTATAIQPYVTATFRMGVAEHRLFDDQPGLVLGFRKSFARDSDGFTSRIAELTLVASKHLGKRIALHAGGAFWDASLQADSPNAPLVALHDRSTFTIGDQIRAFGGLQVQPIDKAEILIDLGWAPELCYGCTGADQIRLRPELSWGVRYQVADFMNLESGVRVPDIGSANLLDAQIFGQVTFTSWGLRHVVDDLK